MKLTLVTTDEVERQVVETKRLAKEAIEEYRHHHPPKLYQLRYVQTVKMPPRCSRIEDADRVVYTVGRRWHAEPTMSALLKRAMDRKEK